MRLLIHVLYHIITCIVLVQAQLCPSQAPCHRNNQVSFAFWTIDWEQCVRCWGAHQPSLLHPVEAQAFQTLDRTLNNYRTKCERFPCGWHYEMLLRASRACTLEDCEKPDGKSGGLRILREKSWAKIEESSLNSKMWLDSFPTTHSYHPPTWTRGVPYQRATILGVSKAIKPINPLTSWRNAA